MTITYYATEERHDTPVGKALPITPKQIARLAVRLTGGGMCFEDTARAMEMQDRILAGEWSRELPLGRQAVVRMSYLTLKA